jgi:hypothetical protein
VSRPELPWRLAVILIRQGVNFEWMMNQLFKHPEWEALVPTGDDKLALRCEVGELLRAMVYVDGQDAPTTPGDAGAIFQPGATPHD